jgi:Zn-dependent metalloprotease
MARGFERFHYHVAEAAPEEDARNQPAFLGLRTIPPADAEINAGFNSDETAARNHLTSLWSDSDSPTLRNAVAPERPELVPDLQLLDVHDLPPVGTRLVRFEQTYASIPVFGSRVNCELNDQRGMVSADAQLADVQGVSPIASLSPAEVLRRIAEFAGVEPSTLAEAQPPVQPPVQRLFQHPDGGPWHLVYWYRNIPAAPPALTEGARSHGPGDALPALEPLTVDYLVDAHSGEVVYFYSATPMIDLPVACSGIDEDGAAVTFFGRSAAAGFELRDPLRAVITYDLQLRDLATLTSWPADPVANATTDFAATNKAALSAHVNASKVCTFYNGVLFRDGIDDKGMDLINVVNCSNSSQGEQPPVWHNAAWLRAPNSRMVYGQAPGSASALVSYSRFLDVIAHELTHGVTNTTSALVYKDQTGALNESFSDIFGIMVKNWNSLDPDGGNVTGWDWEIGSGLGGGGLPLRDLSDPARCKCRRQPDRPCPAHMDDYLVTTSDNGGVHTNSNIHNKAAHNLLTAVDAGGNRVLTPREAAYLYYLCLVRLSSLATFADARNGLVDAASTLFTGDAAKRQAAVAAIQQSYRAVGIQ